jgi:hypothetical protein
MIFRDRALDVAPCVTAGGHVLGQQHSAEECPAWEHQGHDVLIIDDLEFAIMGVVHLNLSQPRKVVLARGGDCWAVAVLEGAQVVARPRIDFTLDGALATFAVQCGARSTIVQHP